MPTPASQASDYGTMVAKARLGDCGTRVAKARLRERAAASSASGETPEEYIERLRQQNDEVMSGGSGSDDSCAEPPIARQRTHKPGYEVRVAVTKCVRDYQDIDPELPLRDTRLWRDTVGGGRLCRLLFNGDRVAPDQTLRQLGFQSGNVLDLVCEQKGGGPNSPSYTGNDDKPESSDHEHTVAVTNDEGGHRKRRKPRRQRQRVIAESEDEDEATNNEESGEAAPRRQRQRVIAESEDEDGTTNNEESGEAAPRRQRQRFLAAGSEDGKSSAGEAEGRDGQEGVAGDEAMGNASDGDVPMAAPTSFACALCTSEKPMASAVNVDGCKHPDALVCGSCMFTEIFGNAAACPLCRAPALALVRVATGRRYEVTDTTLSRNDTQGGALAAPGDPDACHTCHKFGFLFVCKGCKQNRCFRCSGLDWPPEESDPFYCDTCAAARAATNARPDRREEGETLIARIMSLGEVQSLETAAAVLSVGSDSTSISERLNPAEMVRAQKAYRWLAARIHPDKLPECGDATAAFQVLERAWSLWRHLFESSRGNAGNAGVAGYEHRSDDGADEGGAQPAAEPATPANEQQAQQRAQEASARAARFQQHQQQRVRAPDIASNGLEPLPGQQVEYAPLETSKVQRHPPLTLQTPLHWLAPPR